MKKKITITLTKSREGFQVEKLTNATVVGAILGNPNSGFRLGDYISEKQAQELCDSELYEVTLNRPK